MSLTGSAQNSCPEFVKECFINRLHKRNGGEAIAQYFVVCSVVGRNNLVSKKMPREKNRRGIFMGAT